jgi:hypothetical protein
VFAADFAILVAVAIVETCLAHAGSPLPAQRSNAWAGRFGPSAASRGPVKQVAERARRFVVSVWRRRPFPLSIHRFVIVALRGMRGLSKPGAGHVHRPVDRVTASGPGAGLGQLWKITPCG